MIVVEGKPSGKRKLYEDNVNVPQKIHRISTAKKRLIFLFDFPDMAESYRPLVRGRGDFRFDDGINTLRCASQQQAIGFGED